MKDLAYRISQIFLCSVVVIGLGLSQPVLATPSPSGLGTVYGWHMMSTSERKHFRYLLTLQNSAQDRENFLILHKLKMQYRASRLQSAAPKTPARQNLRRASLSGRVIR